MSIKRYWSGGVFCDESDNSDEWNTKITMIKEPKKNKEYIISSQDFDMLANLYWSLRLNGNHERADDLANLLKRLDPERCKPRK